MGGLVLALVVLTVVLVIYRERKLYDRQRRWRRERLREAAWNHEEIDRG